ncbi:hypothetical protein MKEN_01395000 [Mycena kentingensis (nom. inval.)]|nr:hypothetical protein MKEN_01395000 [Mycena kentingensis (nom. inval.)]
MLVLLGICTTHWSISLVRYVHAFIYIRSPEAVFFYLFDNREVLQLVNTALSVFSGTVGDTVIIHRLWIVWGRDLRIVVFPIVTCLVVFVCGCAMVWSFSQSTLIEGRIIQPGWITAEWVFSVLTTVYCTAFIILRIYRTMGLPQRGAFKSILGVLVEHLRFPHLPTN